MEGKTNNVDQEGFGGLPLTLVAQWLKSNRQQKTASLLLEPYKVSGYSVCSDSAGLTKLSKEKSLLEILAIVNRPKEIVHGYSSAIGGLAVGIWAADNTHMFYPDSVSPDAIMSMLLTVQDEISKCCHIKIGFAAHYGQFYLINGGLYGLAADYIEEIAENETEGGEIVVSKNVRDLLSGRFILREKSHDLFSLLDGPRGYVPPLDVMYPVPFSKTFYSDLCAYTNRPTETDSLTVKYTQNKVVVLVERQNRECASFEVGMLTNLTQSVKMQDLALQLLEGRYGMEIKVIGALGLYVFDSEIEAISFAEALREKLKSEEITCRIGIDAGPVFIFDLSVGRDIAGSPVNMASKMAQDKGKWGRIYLSVAMKKFVDVAKLTEVKYSISGVDMIVYHF